MKRVLALAGAFVLAGCATANNPGSTAAASGTSVQAGTYYCWRDKLSTDGDNLVCNWDRERHVACDATYAVTINRSRVAAGPADAGRCNNGQWLVMVTTR